MTEQKILQTLMLLLFSTLCFSQTLTREMALEDLNEFKMLLKTQSSYYQVSKSKFETYYNDIERTINQKDSIPVYFLAFELEKGISNIIDRHANIRMEDFEEDDHKLYNLYLPFAVSSLGDKVVALKFNRTTKEYEYYFQKYPFVKKVNNIEVETFLETYAYRRNLSPTKAKLTDGLNDLRDLGEIYFKQGDTARMDVDIILTNGNVDKKLTLPLSDRKNWYFSIGSTSLNRKYSNFGRDRDFDLNKLDTLLIDSIAYIAIPSMIGYEENPNLESYLKLTIEKYKDSKALIIDIRGNGGGTRDILNTLSSYFIQPEQSPWVANIAYVRSDQFLDEDISSMQSRFLYNYNSPSLTDKDREAIDKFNKEYKTEIEIDANKFSQPYYMVLHSNQHPLDCPIYILVDEECFSAASVFTAALKGLDNVKIVGVTTNGSSGRSMDFYLKNSNIRLKLSTMLSFQRNGKTLDGNGTVPDIVLERDEKQLLRKNDTQLERLIALINN